MTKFFNFSHYIDFLREFSSLYDFKMSEFVTRKVWESIPSEWIDYFVEFQSDNIEEIFAGTSKNLPKTLKHFIQTCHDLNILGSSTERSTKNCLTNEEKKRFTAKKVHEIEYLAPFITETCKQYECTGIVDVGCGLGYLSEILSSKIDYIIGIDCVAGHCDKASYRAMTKNIPNIKFVSMTVDNSELCRQKINDLIACHLSNGENLKVYIKKFAFVGLHCCGDLQPIILKLFERIDEADLCFTISCCYHKMSFEDSTAKLPKMFPMCASVKQLIDQKQNEHSFNLSKFALRVASQETKSRWIRKTKEDWNLHEKNTFYRGIVECLATEGINMKKTKKRIARPNDFENFTIYLSALLKRAKFTSDLNDDEIREKLKFYYENNVENMKFVKILTILQTLIQSVLESLILLDRIEFVKETRNICELLTIFDDKISPRNSLLLARKKLP